MSSPIVEKYYTIQELSFLLSFSTKYVRSLVHDGALGEGCVDVGNSIRVPASGVVAFLAAHPLITPASLGISARTPGELRRKSALA